jgi:hypothetical protein
MQAESVETRAHGGERGGWGFLSFFVWLSLLAWSRTFQSKLLQHTKKLLRN